ncbi:MAG: hypothetical protein DRP01_06170 [Archaeoglobales archaeon]|nr:MAG: hypothetical protein DRP01_06170 [Archaeoglobales archaeon]
MEEMTERMLAKMVEAMNIHLPKKSRSLAEMLKEDYPKIVARDGNEYLIERRELEFIAQHVEDVENFKIPIILEMCGVGDTRLIYVKDRLHAEFIKRVFGYDRFVEGNLVLHLHEIVPIRRKLRTATQIAYRVML